MSTAWRTAAVAVAEPSVPTTIELNVGLEHSLAVRLSDDS
jgi:hypothetical protein